MATGSAVPASVAIMSRAWRLVRRASCTLVRFDRAGQGAVNSGRAVATKSTRAVAPCAMMRPSSSSDEASHQCRSSTSSTSGWMALIARFHCASSSIVFRRCTSGFSANGVGGGRPRKSASSPTDSGVARSRSPRVIFSTFSAGVSAGVKASPCATSAITG